MTLPETAAFSREPAGRTTRKRLRSHAPFAVEQANAHFDDGAATPRECLQKAFRLVRGNVRLGGQFPRCRSPEFDVGMANHRHIAGRIGVEAAAQPLPAGRLGERELSGGVDCPKVILVVRVGGESENCSIGAQAEEPVEGNRGGGPAFLPGAFETATRP